MANQTPRSIHEPLFGEGFLRRLENLALIYRHAARSQMQGERRSSRRGQSVEFSDFRPYSLGDDFRRIDWNAYARLEKLFLKLFVDEEDIVLHLLLDNSPSMDWGAPSKLKFCQQAAAALGYVALVGLDRVTASAIFEPVSNTPHHFPAVRGKNSALRLFSFLQSIQPGNVDGSPNGRLNAILSGIKQPGVIIIFSDLMGEIWQPTLNQLAGRQHEITILHVLSPDELSPALSGEFRLTDQEGGAPVEITADFEMLQKYLDRLRDWQASWGKYCAARRIGYLPVSSSTPLEDLLFARMPAVGVLK